MTSDNDNRPPAAASRLLPILGQVGRDGRLRMTALAPPLDRPDDAAPPAFPNDPREA
jgi:hypothetical protein